MKVGDTLRGQITAIRPYGAFVELPDGTIGLIHISELRTGYVDDIYQVVKLGQTVTVQVIDIDAYTQKVSFSIRSLENAVQRIQQGQRFSKSRYKIGFKPLADNLSRWIAEGLADCKVQQEPNRTKI